MQVPVRPGSLLVGRGWAHWPARRPGHREGEALRRSRLPSIWPGHGSRTAPSPPVRRPIPPGPPGAVSDPWPGCPRVPPPGWDPSSCSRPPCWRGSIDPYVTVDDSLISLDDVVEKSDLLGSSGSRRRSACRPCRMRSSRAPGRPSTSASS